MLRDTRTRLLILCLFISTTALASHVSPLLSHASTPNAVASHYSLAPPLPPNATLAIVPKATVDLGRTMQKITIELALNNTPEVPTFNTVQVILSYNTHNNVLNGSSPISPPAYATNLDYSTNVFAGLTSFVVRDCVDGHGLNGVTDKCGSDDGPGIVSFAQSSTTLVPKGTQGNIFFLTLGVNTTAPNFSEIRIVSALLGNGNTPIPTTNQDGYYTSLNCNGVPCPLAGANFTWSPKPPTQGSITVFRGNSSFPTLGAVITDYFWQFGDTNSLRPYRDSGTNSTVTYIYNISGTYTVTLTITDSKGVKAVKSFQIVVVNANIDMGIESLDVQPNPIGANPGIVFTITAILKNYGGVPTNHTSLTLWITINAKAKLLGTFNVTNMKQNTDQTFSVKWDSTGIAPNVYRVDAITPLLQNETRTDPNPNQKSFWIQLVGIQPAGGLSLLSTAGIAIVVVGAGGYGISFLRKRNIPDDKL